MLAEGVPPRAIAAVTFTELAASELLSASGSLSTSSRPAGSRPNCAWRCPMVCRGSSATISPGRAPRLTKSHARPSTASATPDQALSGGGRHRSRRRHHGPQPGRSHLPRNRRGWLRERLSGDQGGILAEMVLHSPGETVALVHKIAENLRRRRTLAAPPVSPLDGHLTAFRQATADFATFTRGTAATEPETVVIAEQLVEMANAVAAGPDPATPAGLVRLLASRPPRTFAPRQGPSPPIARRANGRRRQSRSACPRPMAIG